MDYDDFEVVSRYTRAEAIADGVLIDISEMAREAGIKFPTAITAKAYQEYIVPHDDVRAMGECETGRLWDTLMMLRLYAKNGGRVIKFPVIYSFAAPSKEFRCTKELIAVCGSGDTPEAVITLMALGED